MAIPIKTILKAVLFIGLLLICIGLYYYYYDKRSEGFQTGGWTKDMCSSTTATKDQKCNSSCGDQTINPLGNDRTTTNTLPPETDDETAAYDIYESMNLDNPPIFEPLPKVPTTNTKYNTAAALSIFDTGVPIPWDYDNLYEDPVDVLWGFIHPEVSQKIFNKAEAQATCGNINNLEQDPNSGRYSYQSQYFKATLYDPAQGTACQYADFFVDFYAEIVFESLIESAFTQGYQEAVWFQQQRVSTFTEEKNKLIDAFKAKNVGMDEKLLQENLKKEMPRIKTAAKSAVKEIEDSGKFKAKFKEIQKTSKLEQKAAEEIGMVDRYKGIYKQNGMRGVIKKTFGFQNVDDWKTGPWDKSTLTNSEKAIAEANIAKRSKQVAKLEQEMAIHGERLKYLRPGKSINAFKSMGKMYTALGKRIQKITGRVLKILGIKAASKLIGTISAKIGNLLLGACAKLGIAEAVIALSGPVGWALDVFLTILTLACITIIPALFGAFIEEDAVCPEGAFNLQTAITASSGVGDIGWNLFTGIPGLGDVSYAFGSYLCFKPDGSTVLKQNLIEPVYYQDPTLSIYSIPNKPKFKTGGSGQSMDARLTDPAAFHECPAPPTTKPLADGSMPDATVTCEYQERINSRVWVDYSNEYMLNKMAQFYFDASRKFMETTEDGMVQFEYISKFYGVISTTELTCDVLCEITVVKLNIATGNKICEFTLENPDPNVKKNYHDRRFYFYKDLSRGMSTYQRTNASKEERMADNYVKFIVSACTHADGTAPDAFTTAPDGTEINDPIISLGQPGGTYYPPILQNTSAGVTNSVLASKDLLPDDPTCGITKKSYSKYGNTANIPITTSSDGSTVTTSISIRDGDPARDTAQPWDNKFLPMNSNTRISTREINIEGKTYKSAKYMDMQRVGCRPDDNDCIINSSAGSANIVLTSISGFLPYQWGMTGGIITTTTGVVGLPNVVTCMFTGAAKMKGTFVLNGNVIVSTASDTKTGYLIWFGPVVDYAPGYTPSIEWCKNQGLELYDCVNRNTVRTFVKKYHDYYDRINRPRQIKRIGNISPRRVTTIANDGNRNLSSTSIFKQKETDLVFNTNMNNMCVYDISYVNFDPTILSEVPNSTAQDTVGMVMKQNKDAQHKTCTFVCDDTKDFYDKSLIPNLEPFSKNMEAPDLPFAGGDCDNNDFKNNLITQFNKLPENINALQITVNGLTNAYTVTGNPETKRYKKCIYDAKIKVYDNVKYIEWRNPSDIDPSSKNVIRLTFTLDPNVDNNTKTENPIFFHDYPGTDILSLNTFAAASGCTNTSFDCRNSALQASLINDFNKAHINYPKLISIDNVTPTKLPYTIADSSKSIYKCIYTGTFNSVYNPVTDLSNSSVERVITMYLQKPSNKTYLFQYFRFTITATRVSGTIPSIKGLKVGDDSSIIPWNSGAQAYFNTINNANTIFLSTTRLVLTSIPLPVSIIIDNITPITFTAYGWTMNSQNEDPVSWILEGSTDGISWITIDNNSSSTNAPTFVAGSSITYTPSITPPTTTPFTYRYLQFTITAVRVTGSQAGILGFKVINNTSVVPWNSGAQAYYNTINYFNAQKFFDSINPLLLSSVNLPVRIIIDNKASMIFTKYRWKMNDVNRDPIRWILEGSADAVTWTVIHDKTASDNAPTFVANTYTEYYTPVNNLTFTYRYLRFTITAVRVTGSQPAVYGFQLANDTNTLSWNSGATAYYLTNAQKIFSSKADAELTKINVNSIFSTEIALRLTSTSLPISIFIDNTTPISSSTTYGWNMYDTNGDPVRWTLYGSTDGISWIIIDDKSTSDNAPTFVTGTPVTYTPTSTTPFTYRYLRFTITAVRVTGSQPTILSFQVANGTTKNSWNSGAQAYYYMNADTSYANRNTVNMWPVTSPQIYSLVINNITPVLFTYYSWKMDTSPPGNVILGPADPIRWSLEGSLDGNRWTTIDNKTGEDQIVPHVDSGYIANIYPPSDKCIYELDHDDFPLYTSYIPIPKRGQWFDVPPRTATKNTNFKRSGCTNDAYKDCSNVDLINNLVTQFNMLDPNQKILEVTRSYTPLITATGGTTPIPTCDYDVQLVRGNLLLPSSDKNIHIVNKETIRFKLKDSSDSTNLCMYDLDTVGSESKGINKSNTGYSLNSSKTLGSLDTPYIWSPNVTTTISQQIKNFIYNYFDMDPVALINKIATDSLSKISALRTASFTVVDLISCTTTPSNTCATKKCNDDTVLKAMINRYNFDNYPPYNLTNNSISSLAPDTNAVVRKSIVRVNRSGIALKTRCHMEMIERTETFSDFLYNTPNIMKTYTYKKIGFDLTCAAGNQCKYSVSSSYFDISGDPYGIQSDSTILGTTWLDFDYVEPRMLPIVLPSTETGILSSSISYPDLTDANVIKILQKVIDVYNANSTTDINGNIAMISDSVTAIRAPDPVTGTLTSYYNQIQSKRGANDSAINRFLKAFNPRPNICEFKVQVSHVYKDTEFNIVYRTGDINDSTNLYGPDETYIIATWAPGTAYEIETGFFCKKGTAPNEIFCDIGDVGAVVCAPTLQEIYLPEYTFTTTGLTKTSTNATTVLPYLANDGNVDNMNLTDRRFICMNSTCVDSTGKRL